MNQLISSNYNKNLSNCFSFSPLSQKKKKTGQVNMWITVSSKKLKNKKKEKGEYSLNK